MSNEEKRVIPRSKKNPDKKQNILVKSYFSKSEIEQLDKNRGHVKAQPFKKGVAGEEDQAEVMGEKGVNRSQFMRSSALGHIPPVRVDSTLIRELGRIGGNMNQVARYANTKKAVDVAVLEQLQRLEIMLENTLDGIVDSIQKKGGDKL